MRYDVEDFLDDLFAIAQNDLPAKLLEIATQKADGIVIPPPQKYINDWNGEQINASTILYFNFAENDSSNAAMLSASAATIIPVTVHVVIAFNNPNPASPGLREKLAHRYRRALLEIYNTGFLKQRSSAVSGWKVLPLPQDQNYYAQANQKDVGVAVHGGLVI